MPSTRRRTQQRKTLRLRHRLRHRLHHRRRPLSPQEALEVARVDTPGLGIATVNRAIKRFLAEGVLVAVELPGAPPRYELAGLEHHHHFHCRACDRVYDVEGGPPRVTEFAPDGVELEAHEVALLGLCAGCTEAPPPAPDFGSPRRSDTAKSGLRAGRALPIAFRERPVIAPRWLKPKVAAQTFCTHPAS